MERVIDGDSIVYIEDGRPFLSISEKVDGTQAAVTLAGELRSETCSAFLDEMNALLSVGISPVLDLNHVTYMSAAYIKAFVQLQVRIDKRQGTLRITGVAEEVYSEFEKTGASELLWIERG